MGGLTRFEILRDLLPDINTARWVQSLMNREIMNYRLSGMVLKI